MTTNELWTIGIALYGAVVSTFVLGWDAYKWLASGARLKLYASTNMKIIGGFDEDDKTYISLRAYNIGDRPTTITNMGGMYYESWWAAYIFRRKPKDAFIVTSPSQAQPLPYRFEVGSQWMGLLDQSPDLIEMTRTGYLFLTLYTAQVGPGHRTRVHYRKTLSEASR